MKTQIQDLLKKTDVSSTIFKQTQSTCLQLHFDKNKCITYYHLTTQTPHEVLVKILCSCIPFFFLRNIQSRLFCLHFINFNTLNREAIIGARFISTPSDFSCIYCSTAIIIGLLVTSGCLEFITVHPSYLLPCNIALYFGSMT